MGCGSTPQLQPYAFAFKTLGLGSWEAHRGIAPLTGLHNTAHIIAQPCAPRTFEPSSHDIPSAFAPLQQRTQAAVASERKAAEKARADAAAAAAAAARKLELEKEAKAAGERAEISGVGFWVGPRKGC